MTDSEKLKRLADLTRHDLAEYRMGRLSSIEALHVIDCHVELLVNGDCVLDAYDQESDPQAITVGSMETSPWLQECYDPRECGE